MKNLLSLKNKAIATLLTAIFVFSTTATTYASIMDYFVFNVSPINTYMGHQDGARRVSNSQFLDIQGHWAEEAIVYGTALGILPFGGTNFFPGAAVTFQEGLAIAVNLMGEGDGALQAGIDITTNVANQEAFWDTSLEDTLHIGFLEVARDNDIITQTMFNALLGLPLWDEAEVNQLLNQIAVAAGQQHINLVNQLNELLSDIVTEFNLTTPLEALNLPSRTDPITREQLATFVARALEDNDAIALPNQPRDILGFSDWQTIGAANAQYVEALVRINVLSGDGASFNPQGSITRAEVARLVRNLDNIFHDENDISRYTGTVAAYRNNQEPATLQGDSWRNLYIRRFDGDVDVIQHQLAFAPTGLTVNYNVPVFRNGIVGGLEILEINDQIEYLVFEDDDDDNILRVLYINVVESGQNFSTVTMRLMELDAVEGLIRVRDSYGNDFLYNLTSGTFGQGVYGPYLTMDNFVVQWDEIPFGAYIELSLINNLVSRISFVGQPVLVLEMRGVVIDNNPAFGYLTVIDNYGNIVTRFYNQHNMQVQRQTHYSQASGASYLAQMFPNFNFNPHAASISDLQPGDIVFMRFDENDPTLITNISSAVHHVMRHGLVRQVSSASGVVSMLLQLDNGQTSWFDLGPNIFITSQGRAINNSEVQVGDRIRLLVNQAILGPGHIVESVLEAVLESQGHHIGTILTGHLAGINSMQQNLMLQNSRSLTGLGWGPHTQIQELNLNRQNVQFFHEGQQISIDHANRFLSRSDLNTYVAMDQSPFGESIRQITFRNGRDELLNADVVLSTTAQGGFIIPSVSGTITTDEGTIVRRGGRQVSGNDIQAGDNVRVSLNGGNNAAIVDILDTAGVSAVGIARARVLNVNQGASFTVQSMATLQGHDWMFTPVERVFTINPNTLFLNEDGWVDPTMFRTQAENSVYNQVFTVIYDGSQATHVISMPHGNRVVRGQIVSQSGTTINLTNSQYLYNPNLSPTYEWRSFSAVNPTLNITTHPNSIIIRNNQIIQPRDLQLGDNIRILTHNLPTMAPGANVRGYIILVD